MRWHAMALAGTDGHRRESVVLMGIIGGPFEPNPAFMGTAGKAAIP